MKQDILWVDLETRSRCDLPKRGVYNYAADKSTEILIASYAINDEDIKRWEPWRGQSIPARLANALRNKRVQLRAHNATFERLLLSSAKLCDAAPERWHCTSMQARACALPAALDNLMRALLMGSGTKVPQKDHRGSALIRELSIPREDGTFNNDKLLLEEFGEYCDQDVHTMRTASMMMPALTDEAQRVWRANEVINDRGLPIDIELCELAVKYAAAESAEAESEVQRLTRGALKKARGTKLLEWVYDKLPPEAQRLMRVKSKMTARARADAESNTGTDAPADKRTLDSDTRAALLNMAEENTGLIDPEVVEVISAADAAASSSVAKFERMRNIAGADGRLRGAFIANGASGTGRFSSTGSQLHNFPRECAKDPEAVKTAMRRGEDLGGSVLRTLKSMLRPAIYAGASRRIVRCDWSAIEARGLPWLTHRAAAVHYLDAFRDKSRDIYVEQSHAAGLGGERQPGKVVVLSLGYGGAEGALNAMAKAYGVTIPNPKRVVQRWRAANKWAPDWWYEMERMAKRAQRDSESWHDSGRVAWSSSPAGGIPFLRMGLPSGRILHYPFASCDDDGLSYLKAAWKPKADAKTWPRARLWGGLAAENATQASCGDLMREAVVRGVDAGLPLIGHVHDELIGESSARSAAGLARDIKSCMLTLPDWAGGLPLAAETDISPRYRK